MIIPITLEEDRRQNGDSQLLLELEMDAKSKAFKKEGKVPTLMELLYNKDEDDIVTITEFLNRV